MNNLYGLLKPKIEKYKKINENLKLIHGIFVWISLLSINIVPYFFIDLNIKNSLIVLVFSLGIIFLISTLYLYLLKKLKNKYLIEDSLLPAIESYDHLLKITKEKNPVENAVSNIINSIRLNNENLNIKLDDTEETVRSVLSYENLSKLFEYVQAEKAISALNQETK